MLHKETVARLSVNIVVLLAFLACAALPPLGCGSGGDTWDSADDGAATRLHVDGRWIRDSLGRSVVLRGINVGSRTKLPPFLPWDSADPGPYLDQIASWGLNSIRLLFVWEAVEPEPGRYDEAYLARLAEILDACAERGIIVILDSHQDLFARNFCGDGFPQWAIPPDHQAEECSTSTSLWPLFYVLDPGVPASFDRFWSDPGLRKAYTRMMVHVAKRLGSHKVVVGIDLVNEPYDASYWRLDGSFDREILAPFHEEVGAAVLEEMPRALPVYGTCPLSSVGFPTTFAPPDLPEVVFGAHWYSLAGLLFGTATDLTSLRSRLEAFVEFSESSGVPVWIGEYGLPTHRTDNVEFLAGQVDLIDELMLGSAIWTYNPTEVDWNSESTSLVGPGGEEKPHVDALVRPYPSRVAGTPASFGYDRASGVFRLAFEADPEAAGPTEVAVPQRSYPTGFDVEIEGTGEWSWEEDRRRLLFRSPQDGEARGIRLLPHP